MCQAPLEAKGQQTTSLEAKSSSTALFSEYHLLEQSQSLIYV